MSPTTPQPKTPNAPESAEERHARLLKVVMPPYEETIQERVERMREFFATHHFQTKDGDWNPPLED